MGKELGEMGARKPTDVVWHEEAPEGKLDLVVTLDFRMSTTCVYSDVVLPTAAIEDVTPTVLYLLGLPVSRDLPGRVMEEVLDPNLPAQRPVRSIDSYRRLVPAPITGGVRDERANEAELEKLRELGYVW